MLRGYRTAVRSLAVIGALAVTVQCGGQSSAKEASAATTVASTAVEPSTTEVPTTTAPATTAPATSTTVAITTTTAQPEPTTTTAPALVIDPSCPQTAHGAVIDRDRQRAWLCDHGVALPEFVITTAVMQPDPGTYPVYAKSMHASSTFGGHYSTMTHFVAFTRGKKTGARIAFHTVPVLTNGQYVQPLDSVGTAEHHGDSAGCIRVLPDQGPVIWDWLQKGDEVHVIT